MNYASVALAAIRCRQIRLLSARDTWLNALSVGYVPWWTPGSLR